MSHKCFSHLLNLSLAWHTKVRPPNSTVVTTWLTILPLVHAHVEKDWRGSSDP
jgi:hypothetical protein